MLYVYIRKSLYPITNVLFLYTRIRLYVCTKAGCSVLPYSGPTFITSKSYFFVSLFL